jgi:hypothetical protein
MFWVTVIMTVVNAGIGISVWWNNRDKITNARFKVLEDDVITLKSDVKHRPDCQYHQGFETRLDKLHGGIKHIEGVVEGRMEGIGKSLDIIQQHLLRGGK